MFRMTRPHHPCPFIGFPKKCYKPIKALVWATRTRLKTRPYSWLRYTVLAVQCTSQTMYTLFVYIHRVQFLLPNRVAHRAGAHYANSLESWLQAVVSYTGPAYPTVFRKSQVHDSIRVALMGAFRNTEMQSSESNAWDFEIPLLDFYIVYIFLTG